jgi:hypothetical protein
MLFNEQIALKTRLDQLSDAEIRMLHEFRKERENIIKRLQELDGEIDKRKPAFPTVAAVGLPPKIPRGRRSESLTVLRDATIIVLKEQNNPIRGVELQRFVEERTGKKIANMTTFMNGLERKNERVRKLGRGLYIYEYGM